jgi:peptidoglycan hydrolase-like protein with peptidoglycan-binding domain
VSGRRAVSAVSWVAAGAVVVTAAFWAGRAATDVPTIASPPDAVETVVAQDGQLGRSVEVTIQARWDLSDTARAAVGGTVTTTPDLSDVTVEAGTTLLTIDLRPVVLAQGGVPAFRDMTQGDVGQDVGQLQDFLRASEFLSSDRTDSYDASTTSAVKAWQKSLGLEQTGIVRQGDLLFVESLPARLVLDSAIEVGSLVEPGDVLVQAVSPSPELWVESDESQANPLRPDVAVVVESGDTSWDAVVSRSEPDPEAGVDRLMLSSPDGGAVCGTECGAVLPVLPRGASAILTGRAVLTPQVSGAMVPQSSLATTATGDNIVLGADGGRVPVDVLVVADGQAIVTGVSPGDTLRLYGSDE